MRSSYLLARSLVLSDCADTAGGRKMAWKVRNVSGELETCLLLPAVPQVAVGQQKACLTFPNIGFSAS